MLYKKNSFTLCLKIQFLRIEMICDIGKSTREPKGEGMAGTKNTKPIWPECFLEHQ